MAEAGQPLPLTGRDRVIIDKFSRELYQRTAKLNYPHSNVWETLRGNEFEVMLPSGHVATVLVTLTRFDPKLAR